MEGCFGGEGLASLVHSEPGWENSTHKALITGPVTWHLPSFQMLSSSFSFQESQLPGTLAVETEGALPEGCLGQLSQLDSCAPSGGVTQAASEAEVVGLRI